MLKYVVLMLVLLVGRLGAQGYQYEGDCCWYNRLEVGADWIYWKASQEEMELAVLVNTVDSTVTATPLLPDFSYNSGYKVYLGYDLTCDWVLYARLTHLPSVANVSAFVDPAAALADTASIAMNSVSFPIFLNINTGTAQVISNMEASWDLNLYYLDVDVSRSCFSCGGLDLGSYFGLRGMWMKQTLDVDAFTPNFGGEPGVTALYLLEQNAKIDGVGIQGGMNGYYRMGYGFSLVGEFGGSLLYSRFNLEGEFAIDTLDSGAAPAVTDINFGNITFYKSITTVDTAILLQYATCLCGYGIELHVGWENHIFFHTNFLGLSESGNLTMQGLTLGGSFRF